LSPSLLQPCKKPKKETLRGSLSAAEVGVDGFRGSVLAARNSGQRFRMKAGPVDSGTCSGERGGLGVAFSVIDDVTRSEGYRLACLHVPVN